jgi:lipoprotein-anchoring transpeptidase ErfK/SrfK
MLLAGTVLTAGLALVIGRAPLAASAASGVDTCPAWVTSAPTRALPFVAFVSRPVAAGPRTAIVAGSAPARSRWADALVEYWQAGSAPNCAVPHPALAGGAGRIDAELDRLRPASRYRFRLAARTARGTAFSGSRTFTTLPAGRIPDGVVVGKVPLGRMTPAVALTVLARAYAKPLRLTFAGAFWHIAPAKAGLRASFAAAIRGALAATPRERLPAPRLTVGTGPLNAYVARLGKHFGHGQARGDVRLVGTHAVVTPAAPTVAVDTVRIAALIRAQLESGNRSLLSLAVKTRGQRASARKAVVIRLGAQTLTAYLNGKPVLTTPITSGRPTLPTPIGSFSIEYRASPYVFTSPWPAGSPYWYPPTPVTWAMFFYDNDFLHDDPLQPAGSYGAGSENGPYASHGCVHVPHQAMAFLYNWLPVGAQVIVAQS